jgi:4-amino-4-deoxy-L-arabinose transferase-like glycosyltransferase
MNDQTATSSYWKSSQGQGIILAVILCGSAVLLLANLGNQYLWEDEAQTALISKTVLTDGVPRGYDSKNYFSQEKGAEYGKNYIWKWHTWLPFYVLAGFYKAFGVNTFVSRLPFALFGLGTVGATYYFARSLWPGRRIAAIAGALLAVSVPFLLLSRQCRYYSMSMFFSVLSLHAYMNMLNGKKRAGLMLFFASTLLLHTQHFYMAVLFPALAVHAVIYNHEVLKKLLIVIAGVMLFNLPWLLWLANMNYSQGHITDLSTNVNFIMAFCADILRYLFPVWLLAIILIITASNRIRKGRLISQEQFLVRNISLLVLFVIFNVVVIAFTCPLPYFRYIAPSVPIAILLVAVIVDSAAHVHMVLAIVIVAGILSTGKLKDYFYEITHDYKGPIKGIVSYLREHGSKDDVVAISYGDMPLKFYTDMRVIGGLTGEDLEPALNARWVIFRKNTAGESGRLEIYLILNDINLESEYRRIELNSPDIQWENREDIADHQFRTCTDEDKVVIYEKINIHAPPKKAKSNEMLE